VQGGGQPDKNRSLPQDSLCRVLGQKTGQNVVPDQLFKALNKQFGADSSAKTLKYLTMARGYAEKGKAFADKQAAKGGAMGQKFGLLAKLLGMCLSATATAVRLFLPIITLQNVI
jgi:hypothetical protein